MKFYQAYHLNPDHKAWNLSSLEEAKEIIIKESPETVLTEERGLWFDTNTGYGIALIIV